MVVFEIIDLVVIMCDLIYCGLSVGIVRQEALVDALVNKRIYAAGLDVMSPEPLPVDDILLKLENVGEF